jgi:hypothetical protein
MADSMFRFLPQAPGLRIHYLNMTIAADWATALGRPELAGLVVGMAEVEANIEYLTGVSDSEPYQPNYTDGVLDVSLGILDRIQQAGHEGTHPNGIAGITMATTSCNVGSVDVPWLAPMEEDHPLIHMALYRELDGRFEQIGVSWMKHGFFALSNSQCTPCQNPSNGTFLGVGCSDTYGPGNNADRRYLGPRDEVDPFAGTWECTGSHFAGGVPDCVRRHTGSGHSSTEHRLVVEDADLDNSNATYFYEGYYVVRGDQNRMNNWASRICTMSWNGGPWEFTTPTQNNPHVEGPALLRWGTLQTFVQVPDDGQVLLAVSSSDLGNGVFNYEYALLNMDSDREIRSFSIPVMGIASVTNMDFHDSDSDPGNDWNATLDSGVLSWSTEEFGNENARPLVFGEMMNFRFDADSPPVPRDVTLGIFKPGTGAEVTAQTMGPMTETTAVAESGASAAVPAIRLHPSRPNPFNGTTTIRFELAESASVRLTVIDASGRLVRTLVDRTVESGSHDIVWDGTDSGNRRVASGVYYARVQTGGEVRVQSMAIVE